MASHSHSRLQNSTFHRHPPALVIIDALVAGSDLRGDKHFMCQPQTFLRPKLEEEHSEAGGVPC
eukprot:1533865-Pyramimonas_sp.AAC.1